MLQIYYSSAEKRLQRLVLELESAARYVQDLLLMIELNVMMTEAFSGEA